MEEKIDFKIDSFISLSAYAEDQGLCPWGSMSFFKNNMKYRVRQEIDEKRSGL
jgi:hypothetical protein